MYCKLYGDKTRANQTTKGDKKAIILSLYFCDVTGTSLIFKGGSWGSSGSWPLPQKPWEYDARIRHTRHTHSHTHASWLVSPQNFCLDPPLLILALKATKQQLQCDKMTWFLLLTMFVALRFTMWAVALEEFAYISNNICSGTIKISGQKTFHLCGISLSVGKLTV